jgi:hypothetical protein
VKLVSALPGEKKKIDRRKDNRDALRERSKSRKAAGPLPLNHPPRSKAAANLAQLSVHVYRVVKLFHAPGFCQSHVRFSWTDRLVSAQTSAWRPNVPARNADQPESPRVFLPACEIPLIRQSLPRSLHLWASVCADSHWSLRLLRIIERRAYGCLRPVCGVRQEW